LSLDEAVSVQPAVREALLRIAREAVANAARHARAPSIAVSLAAGCLQVEDVGCGFDPSVARPEGFGITSMRERAAAIDATVRIRSAIGRGTQVRVTW
jgi:signal transduction histidine kinase